MLRLEVLDYAGPTRWRWRLTDAGGVFVADHQVELDASAWQFEAFGDLHRFLKWTTAPDRRLAHEAELVTEVGDWIGEQVLGEVGVALAEARRPVRLELPAGAAVLGYRPWELARVDGRALAGHRVGFVIDQQPHRPLTKTGVGDRLRMLAVFSLPEDAGALNLRKERYELARLVHDIAKVHNKSIELRVLQYGATRQRLQDALLEQAGWDVVHLSGHGLPAGLILEDDTGRRDLISSTELVDLLDLAADQIKLVTLSACESAAVTATEHLHLLGLAPATREGEHTENSSPPAAGAGSGSLPAVAAGLVARLDCAVLAMRYPVVDDFVIALAGSFYNLVLGKGQPMTRALALSLPQVAPEAPTPGAPALSIGTPALFGSRAAELTLTPPAGGPVLLAGEQQKLAEFPPQPERFVGRVGPMTRATTALAPRSGRVGVVLHGMAGGGKTACALELAYTHQDSFPLMAWHAAPPEGTVISTALSDFARALERQLPGVKLAHLVNDTTALRDRLPRLTEVLEQERVLIVLDNIESLLTDTGAWRDERWALLIEAITNHQGLSRLVLTSRRRPTQLNPAMLVEAVHALSLREAVLLARDWPHLGALIDATNPPAGLTPDQARDLAARTLAMVQGHPKLIELANGHASDPATLTARLEEADRTWLTRGTRLEPFLQGGEPAGTDRDYLSVLQGWTRSTTTGLAPDVATLFGVLSCVEEDDRIRPVIDAVWPRLWRRLDRPGAPPDLDTALVPLVEQALVATEADPDTGQVVRFRIHPGVADTGRTSTGPDLPAAVDTDLGDHWLAGLGHALQHEHEQLGWLVLRAARSAAPYLLRQHRWTALVSATHQVLTRDRSTATAAALLPMLAAAVEATRGTDDEFDVGYSHARALVILNPDQAETLFRQLLDTAVDREKFGNAKNLTGDLINLYRGSGRLDEALALADTRAEYTRRAGYGPWTQLVDHGMRLQILGLQGHYQQVLDTVEELRDQMGTLPDPPDPSDVTIIPWNVREATLNTGVLAANQLGRWQQALDLNTEILDSMRRRGASHTEQAFASTNDYSPLLRLGRTREARDLLIWCRAVFEANNDIPSLGKTVSALAEVEDKLGHRDRAIDLEADALRFKYLAADPDAIGVSHNNLASYLQWAGGNSQQVWAHRLAAAVIDYQTGGGYLARLLQALAGLLANESAVAPGSFAQVCQIVDQIDGVHLADLLARFPRRAPDGQSALDEVLRLASEAGAERTQQLITGWDPVLSALHAATHHPDPATRDTATHTLDHALTARGQHPDWQALVALLRRIHTGDRNPTLTDGLDDIDTAITRRALDLLAGTTAIDPDAWRTLTTADSEDQGDQAEDIAAFAAALAAAATGDTHAQGVVGPVLDQMAADPNWVPLAAALRRILDGDPTPTATDELIPAHAAILDAVRAHLSPPPPPTITPESP